jgi:hypothetical protein
MIIHEAGALTLLNFLIHGQSSESFDPEWETGGSRQAAEALPV